MRSLAFAVAALAALPACSIFMHSMEKPSAQVRDVSISSVGLGGASGQLSLDVSNPNSFGVPLSGVDWQLSINGARAVTGTAELSQEIPAKGVAPVTTTLSISARDAIALGSVLGGGARTYRIDVRLHFSTQVGKIDVDVSKTGELGSGVAFLR
ncbi:MAG TPA: LEA type 2 family protein [Kofleriaceae bacterium]|jgi:LEA14-like dessication related protein